MWDDNQAYEPTAKRPKEMEATTKAMKPSENVAPSTTTVQQQQQLQRHEEGEGQQQHQQSAPWSSTMTSLKAKLQLKSDLKKSQKKRRDRVLDQLKHIEQQAASRVQNAPNIHDMVSLTSQTSIGVDLRELIHDKTEKRANILARDRLRRHAQIVESQAAVAVSKAKVTVGDKALMHTRHRLGTIKTALDVIQETIKPF